MTSTDCGVEAERDLAQFKTLRVLEIAAEHVLHVEAERDAALAALARVAGLVARAQTVDPYRWVPVADLVAALAGDTP